MKTRTGLQLSGGGVLAVENGGTGQSNLDSVTVGNAKKATQDANGNVIDETYATKTELGEVVDNATKITVGSTSTGEPGTEANVVNSGTPSDAILDFTIPRGDPGEQGPPGPSGEDGSTFTPSVDSEGNLSWTNDGGKVNPATVNIRGPKGDKGEPSPGIQKITVEETSPFDALGWSEIAEISESGKASEYFSVGDEKTIELTTGEQVTLVILGLDHDDLTSGGKAGITIGMKELLATTYAMNSSPTNTGGWDESEMRTSTMVTLLSQLPSDLQSVIKQVNKKATAGDSSNSIITSTDKLFLFSEVEIDGTTSSGYASEGEQYEYWKTVKDGKTSVDRIKYLSNGDGSANAWWLRSPYLTWSSSKFFQYVSSTGILTSTGVTNTYGVSFAFCI